MNQDNAASAADAPLASEPVSVPGQGQKRREGFTFTDPGCRTEVRMGILFIMACAFLWLFLLEQSQTLLQMLLVLGALLLLFGIPLQVFDAKRFRRPGFPWKMGLVMAGVGIAMLPEQLYRESPNEPLAVQSVAPLLIGSGLWILLWWPVARSAMRRKEAEHDG